MARRAAGRVGRLRGVAEALGTERSLRPAPHGPHREDLAGRQENVHAGAGRTLRSGARRARKAVEQRAVHDARADRGHTRRQADQGVGGLGTVQVREGRVAAGQAGRVRAQPRIRAAQRASERIDRRQEGVPRQGRLAIHPRALGRGRRPRGGRGRLVGATANRLLPQDRAEPATCRRYSSILSGRKAGSGRTTFTLHSTTRRRARRCST